ncbi:MAG: hypothetical protein HQ551_07080 [Desulfobacteraceae bacterium]|nr:hypothetical protein [Desulfobacteraceae bacterium]
MEKKRLIIVTRLMKGSRLQSDKEFEQYWQKGFAEIKKTELKSIDQSETIEIKSGKRETDRSHMIVISGDDLNIDKWDKKTISDYYEGNEVLLFMIKFIKDQLIGSAQDDRILIAFHWNNDKEFFIASNRCVERDIEGDNKKLFEWPAEPNITYLNYTLGGDRTVLPQVEQMVEAVKGDDNELFNRCFDDLWLALKGAHEIVFLLTQLLALLKLKVYELNETISGQKIILNTFKYLCNGKKSDSLFKEAEMIMPESTYNLSQFILSDWEWGNQARKELNEYLIQLGQLEAKKEDLVGFFSGFRDFLVNISMGKNPLKNHVN